MWTAGEAIILDNGKQSGVAPRLRIDARVCDAVVAGGGDFGGTSRRFSDLAGAKPPLQVLKPVDPIRPDSGWVLSEPWCFLFPTNKTFLTKYSLIGIVVFDTESASLSRFRE